MPQVFLPVARPPSSPPTEEAGQRKIRDLQQAVDSLTFRQESTRVPSIEKTGHLLTHRLQQDRRKTEDLKDAIKKVSHPCDHDGE